MPGQSAATPFRRRSTATAAFLAALLGSVVVTVPPAAAGGPPLTGQGTGIITSIVETSSRNAGPNRIAERALTGTMLTGPLAGGTFEEEVRGVVHPNGTVTFQGTLSFSGTLQGCGDGTLTGRLAGRGTAGAAPVTDAHVALVGGRGATIPAAGTGWFHQDGPHLTYEITYVCR